MPVVGWMDNISKLKWCTTGSVIIEKQIQDLILIEANEFNYNHYSGAILCGEARVVERRIEPPHIVFKSEHPNHYTINCHYHYEKYRNSNMFNEKFRKKTVNKNMLRLAGKKYKKHKKYAEQNCT
jgi:hypothetical protein